MFEDLYSGIFVKEVYFDRVEDPYCFFDIALVELEKPLIFKSEEIQAAFFYDDSKNQKKFENLWGNQFVQLNSQIIKTLTLH